MLIIGKKITPTHDKQWVSLDLHQPISTVQGQKGGMLAAVRRDSISHNLPVPGASPSCFHNVPLAQDRVRGLQTYSDFFPGLSLPIFWWYIGGMEPNEHHTGYLHLLYVYIFSIALQT